MPEVLDKLRPDRDLQCYFERPSAVAALSGADANGFTVSGCWRQQFDWVVVEWNRDNVFEHPALRNLPDGDLSGLHLTYEETRLNAIPIDSNLPATVAWPYLRIWTEENGVDTQHTVPLLEHATPVEGAYSAAAATFELQGTATAGDVVELAWLGEHHTYQIYGGDTLENAAEALAASVNAFSADMAAAADGCRIILTWKTAGANGNRIGVYGNVSGAATEAWSPGWQRLAGGTSPTRWRVDLDFAALRLAGIPTDAVRKMRWTWTADLQAGEFQRSEFQVSITDWTVTGSNRRYAVAGPGSRRVEEDNAALAYTGAWAEARGNYSDGAIRYTSEAGASVRWSYTHPRAHTLYLGTRRGVNCATVSIRVDGGSPATAPLALEDDVLVRWKVAELAAGPHTVEARHAGTAGSYFYLDFFEAAVPGEDLPQFAAEATVTAATDWDTDHSMALAPERTAWLLASLGFRGRANHYAGALWFYELAAQGWAYASGSIEFAGTPESSKITQIWLGPTLIEHLNLTGDTAGSLARAFELQINAGATGVWVEAQGALLTIHARMPGSAGNAITLAAETHSESLAARLSGAALAGGVDGRWVTDLAATPRVNRAARDWTCAYLGALGQYGIAATVAFSMELQHGDESAAAGIAQRYPDGQPCRLGTPALQTNFSPASLAFWQQVYRDMAAVMQEAGLPPYLQFGEVQWWYFPAPGSGMPFYDAYTQSRFQQEFGRPLPVFADGNVDPAAYPEEAAFLAGLIGEFTDAVIAFVRQQYPGAVFEVLYPHDVNEPPLNRAVNLPAARWTPAALACFKTENFTYTGDRNLDKARESILLPMQLGFARGQAAHLVGTGGYSLPWEREAAWARSQGLESVVLFALDQFCLVGCRLPLFRALRRGMFLGK